MKTKNKEDEKKKQNSAAPVHEMKSLKAAGVDYKRWDKIMRDSFKLQWIYGHNTSI